MDADLLPNGIVKSVLRPRFQRLQDRDFEARIADAIRAYRVARSDFARTAAVAGLRARIATINTTFAWYEAERMEMCPEAEANLTARREVCRAVLTALGEGITAPSAVQMAAAKRRAIRSAKDPLDRLTKILGLNQEQVSAARWVADVQTDQKRMEERKRLREIFVTEDQARKSRAAPGVNGWKMGDRTSAIVKGVLVEGQGIDPVRRRGGMGSDRTIKAILVSVLTAAVPLATRAEGG